MIDSKSPVSATTVVTDLRESSLDMVRPFLFHFNSFLKKRKLLMIKQGGYFMDPVAHLVATCMIYLTSVEEEEGIQSEEDIAQLEEFWRALAAADGSKLFITGLKEKFAKLKNIVADADKIVGVRDKEIAEKLRVALKREILLRADALKGLRSGRERQAFLKKREDVKKKIVEINALKRHLSVLQSQLQELRKA